jgi:SAM-dependent methyltransferase
MPTENAAMTALLAVYAERHGRRSAANFDWMMRNCFFHDIELRGRAVLDVGSGTGDMALWAAANDATAVGLEPEADGSSGGMQATFAATAARVGLGDRATLLPQTLDAYAPHAPRFDVILMAAAIIHLDEDACMRLHFDDEARARYREHLGVLARLAAPGATLIVGDVARRNIFATLGRTNPLAPTIEWEKHQHPKLWAALLTDVGFSSPTICWRSLNTLREPGRWILGNRAAAFLTTSSFTLTMLAPVGEAVGA